MYSLLFSVTIYVFYGELKTARLEKGFRGKLGRDVGVWFKRRNMIGMIYWLAVGTWQAMIAMKGVGGLWI